MPVMGTDATLNFDATPNTTGTSASTDLSAYVIGSGVDLPREMETMETTSLGDNSRTFVKGLKNATMSVEFDYNNTLVDLIETIYADTTTANSNYFEYKPDGEQVLAFRAVLQNFVVTSPIGMNTVQTEWQVTGDVTKTDS